MSPAEFGSTTIKAFDIFCKQLAIDRRSDLFGHGIVASTIANVHRDTDKRREPWRPSDFVPGWERPKPRVQTWREQHAVLKAMFPNAGWKELPEPEEDDNTEVSE